MSNDRRSELLKLLSEIDQRIAAAERLTAHAPADDVLLGASAVLRDLRESLHKAEHLLRVDERLR